MTNEEAIKELSVLWERMKRAKESGVLAYKTIMYYDGQYVEALDMAIKALEKEPSDDVISREAVIKHICESKECYKDECKGRLYKRCYDLQWIYDLPSVTPQQKMGRWIRCDILQEFKCSECRKCFRHKTNFCPYCGARMESEGEE